MEQTAIAIPVKPGPIGHPKLSDITSQPQPRYKGHWAIIANDLEATERFYMTLTGSELICRPQPTSSAISWDTEHHRFFIAALTAFNPNAASDEPAPSPGSRSGEVGGGIRYRSPAALAKAVRRMQDAGFTPERIVDRGSLVSVVYKDPNGLTVDAFAPGAQSGQPAAETELSSEAFLSRFG